jgi:hypothetical protein
MPPKNMAEKPAKDEEKRNAALLRVRNNQRRSRARRREYLSELEEKYRTCEQLGVKASAEMQAAARKVLDENNRLRALMRSRGITDAEIDQWMVESAAGQPGASSTAPQLQAMLHRNIPCSSGSGSDCCGSDRGIPLGTEDTDALAGPIAASPTFTADAAFEDWWQKDVGLEPTTSAEEVIVDAQHPNNKIVQDPDFWHSGDPIQHTNSLPLPITSGGMAIPTLPHPQSMPNTPQIHPLPATLAPPNPGVTANFHTTGDPSAADFIISQEDVMFWQQQYAKLRVTEPGSAESPVAVTPVSPAAPTPRTPGTVQQH